MRKTIIVMLIVLVCGILLSQETDSTVTDVDGNVYPVVQIGNQVWIAENLRTTHYSDGTPLEYSEGSTEIARDDTTKRYFYYNNNAAYATRYGCLYTWYAAVRGIKGSDTNPPAASRGLPLQAGIFQVLQSGWNWRSFSVKTLQINSNREVDQVSMFNMAVVGVIIRHFNKCMNRAFILLLMMGNMRWVPSITLHWH